MTHELVQRIGPYDVRYQLSKSWNSVLYLAVESSTKQPVVVKIAVNQDQKSENAISAESDTLRNLCHPNIVRMIGYGKHDGRSFYSMEAGIGLPALHTMGMQFLLKEAIRVAIDVLSGLRHSHQLGIVHCDIKPGNVIFAEGRYKIIDFGIRKVYHESSNPWRPWRRQGTLPFMPSDKTITEYFDLYSVGILFLLLSNGTTDPRSVDTLCRFGESGPLLRELLHKLLNSDPMKRVNAHHALMGFRAMAAKLEETEADSAQQEYDRKPIKFVDALACSMMTAIR